MMIYSTDSYSSDMAPTASTWPLPTTSVRASVSLQPSGKSTAIRALSGRRADERWAAHGSQRTAFVRSAPPSAVSLAAHCEGRLLMECGEQREGLGRHKRAIGLLFLEWLAANLNPHPCRRLRIAQKPRPPASHPLLRPGTAQRLR
jgi:hypothetical protein